MPLSTPHSFESTIKGLGVSLSCRSVQRPNLPKLILPHSVEGNIFQCIYYNAFANFENFSFYRSTSKFKFFTMKSPSGTYILINIIPKQCFKMSKTPLSTFHKTRTKTIYANISFTVIVDNFVFFKTGKFEFKVKVHLWKTCEQTRNNELLSLL